MTEHEKGMMRSTRALCPLCLVLWSACTTEGSSASPEAQSENLCEVRESGSRWVSDSASYQLRAEYGLEVGEELIDVWEVAATPTGHVLVYDAGSARVLELGSDLDRVRTYGREGRGPGEFVYQRALHGDWLAVGDSSFFVLDYRALSEFALAGGFLGYAARQLGLPMQIKELAAHDGRVVYAADVVNRDDGTRSLETWQVEPSSPPSLVRSDIMPRLPRWRARYVRGVFADQAEPLWALHERCAFISDGAADHVLQVDLTTNRADTLNLPQREIPQRSPEDRRRMERLRSAGAAVGMVTGSERVRPTARMKWVDLTVDPDGFVWLEPWRPHSMEADPLTAWIVDPKTGAVVAYEVEGFPAAFLRGAAFVAVAIDPLLRTPVIRKYELERVAQR